MAYTKTALIDKIDQASGDVATFYAAPFVNYLGITSDTGEKYTEIIANYLLERPTMLDSIRKITREGSYNMNHTGQTEREASNRYEERMAMSFFGKTLDHVGEIIDYQTPLKNVHADRTGKIDLMSWREDTNTLYLLELKAPTSQETILRCALEAYTYWKTVDGKKLLHDFGKSETAQIVPTVLICAESKQSTFLKELGDRQRELLRSLNIAVFLLHGEKPDIYIYDD